jgi:hypothetical protein
MMVGIGNSWSTLPSRHAVSRGVAGVAPEPRPLASAPRLRAPAPLLLAGTGRAEASIAWEPVRGATGYDVAISSEGTRPERHLAVRDAEAIIADLEPGSYHATVVALDQDGLESVASKPVHFRVVGYEVPKGAKQRTSGSIVLDKHQRLSLLAADGLELTYNRSTQFVPAPGAVGLSRGEPTLVRLRTPGSPAEVSIRLEPDGLRARVSLAPAVARWPADPVSASVELFDLYGHPIADAGGVSIRTTVNLEPVTVDWKRTGAQFAGTVPPRAGRGPWVVRVEATDPRGTSLGRGFLEVASAKAKRARSSGPTATRSARPRF